MSRLKFDTIDLNSVASPASGSYLVAYDLDGKLKQKDSEGVITEIGSGPVPVETNYPTTTLLKAGQRFIYKGNEWHYMTHDEIDSTGWTGLVDVGFPAPVSKNICAAILLPSVEYYDEVASINNIAYRTGATQSSGFAVLDFIGFGTLASVYKIFIISNLVSLFQNVKFKNANLLILEDIGTRVSFDCTSLSIDETNINDLFTQLSPTIKTATIDVRHNPGAATCNPSIATAKGYTVIT